MDSFSNEDEDDQFFSTLALDEITALEELNVARTVDNTTKTSANTTSTEFDDADDEIFLIGEYVNQQVDNKKTVTAASASTTTAAKGIVGSSKVKVAPVAAAVAGPSSSSSHRHVPFLKKNQNIVKVKEEKVLLPPPPPPPPPRNVSVGKRAGDDDKWLDFLSWFDKQQIFKAPWFQTIPISGLTVSQCKSIIACCKDSSNLAQFGNILMSFYKEMSASPDTCDDDQLRDTTMHFIELMLLRIDNEFGGSSSSKYLSNQNEFFTTFEEILSIYIKDIKAFRTSCIPELLVKVYPKAFSDLLGEAVKTGKVELLIPVCSKNPAIFQKIMQCLYSGDGYSKSEFVADDPDFQNYTISSQKFATKLIQSLEKTLGFTYIKLFPVKFQPLFSFVSVVSTHNNVAANNSMIIHEMCCLLNDLFCECSVESDNGFLTFLVNLFPFTSKILKDKKLMKNLNFKDFPYLWIKVRNSNHFA